MLRYKVYQTLHRLHRVLMPSNRGSRKHTQQTECSQARLASNNATQPYFVLPCRDHSDHTHTIARHSIAAVHPYLEHLRGRQADVVGREGAGHLGLHDVHPHLQHTLCSVNNSGRVSACASRVVQRKIEAVGCLVALWTPQDDKTVIAQFVASIGVEPPYAQGQDVYNAARSVTE
jgi:hypothetical protein